MLAVGAVPCGTCAHHNPPGQDHCLSCGARLTSRCPACERTVYLAAAHCGACGVRLEQGETDLTARLRAAYERIARGDHDGAERILEPIVKAGEGGVDALLELAACKQARFARLAADVRFHRARLSGRFEALALLDRALAQPCTSAQAEYAEQLRAGLALPPPPASGAVAGATAAGLGFVLFVIVAWNIYC